MSSLARQSQQYDDANVDDLMKTLTDNFHILADEVQLLSDRKTILEHKLRFAHEQYQQLADKYAPGNTDIAHTLAALQIPPDLHIQTPERATFVPLPARRPTGSKQQTAEAIRDGRRASQKIASLRGWVLASESGGRSTSGSHSTMITSHRGTSPTTILEQDFTVPGKASKLECPFNPAGKVVAGDNGQTGTGVGKQSEVMRDLTPHQSSDPICAAMYSAASSVAPSASGSAKCPIRYLDQHSPEEVAKYFETHKHEIPRSHEICVKRYQRNEDDIRKLDAKYGNIVSMIQGLGAKHQPMLPVSGQDDDVAITAEAERKTIDRVEKWADGINSDGVDENEAVVPVEDDRQSRFDRPMKEIRVGESPSRPWGISVPWNASEDHTSPRPASPPPAPVVMSDETNAKPSRPKGVCPFGHVAAKPAATGEVMTPATPQAGVTVLQYDLKPQTAQNTVADEGTRKAAPVFLQPADIKKSENGPQMVFTGPVFIGYPVEQAMALMQAWQAGLGTTP